jgi:2-methylcitrate dehydratase PrpD
MTEWATATGTTGALLEQVLGLPLDSPPPDVAAIVRHCILDFLGVTLAAIDEPLAAMLRAELAPDGTGEATILGRRERAPALIAALVNGATAHALDYDDTHLDMVGHPTVAVAPAVVALAERTGARGDEVAAAFLAGVETECRLGRLVNPGHYAVGWHTTGTLGVFGAAAACAHLLRLDDAGFRSALGVAASQAAGLKASFGTMTKPLHAGKAASNGLLAATLASRGFTASDKVLEATSGFFSTSTSEVHLDTLEDSAGRFLAGGTLFKYHAACYLTHAAIEAAAQLRDTDGLSSPELIEWVAVEVHPSCLDVCTIPEPRTGLEAKFSLRATTAMVLLGDDTGDPLAYTDARMADAEFVALRDRIRVETTAADPIAAATVRVGTRDGRQLSATVDAGAPEADLGRQGERVEAKFLTLAAPVIGEQRAAAVVEAVSRLEKLGSIVEITGLLGA